MSRTVYIKLLLFNIQEAYTFLELRTFIFLNILCVLTSIMINFSNPIMSNESFVIIWQHWLPILFIVAIIFFRVNHKKKRIWIISITVFGITYFIFFCLKHTFAKTISFDLIIFYIFLIIWRVNYKRFIPGTRNQFFIS